MNFCFLTLKLVVQVFFLFFWREAITVKEYHNRLWVIQAFVRYVTGYSSEAAFLELSFLLFFKRTRIDICFWVFFGRNSF